MYCDNCGNKINPDKNFCRFCGTKIHSDESINQDSFINEPDSTYTMNKAVSAESFTENSAGSTVYSANSSSTYTAAASTGGKIGYSDRINDPTFAKYIKNTNRWSGIFAIILAVIAVIGFYIAGETSSEMDNPESLYIGFGIGGMFLLIALFQIIGRKRGKDWDGVEVDKRKQKNSYRQGSGDNDYWVN